MIFHPILEHLKTLYFPYKLVFRYTVYIHIHIFPCCVQLNSNLYFPTSFPFTLSLNQLCCCIVFKQGHDFQYCSFFKNVFFTWISNRIHQFLFRTVFFPPSTVETTAMDKAELVHYTGSPTLPISLSSLFIFWSFLMFFCFKNITGKFSVIQTRCVSSIILYTCFSCYVKFCFVFFS